MRGLASEVRVLVAQHVYGWIFVPFHVSAAATAHLVSPSVTSACEGGQTGEQPDVSRSAFRSVPSECDRCPIQGVDCEEQTPHYQHEQLHRVQVWQESLIIG